MPRYKAMVQRIDHNQALLVLEDGSKLHFPLDKLPRGSCEGTFLLLSISVDRLAVLFKSNQQQLAPGVAKT